MKNKKLPEVLTTTEADSLLSKPDLSTLPGIRDKAILELIYCCGLRESELLNLTTRSILYTEGIIRVIGKGDKQRNIPIGPNALKWIRKYLNEARPYLPGNESNILFPNRSGKPYSRMTIWNIVNKYYMLTLITKKISPHSLRHSIATSLLESGADLRSIQETLGHEDMSTTKIYTRISTAHLKTVHKEYHPRW